MLGVIAGSSLLESKLFSTLKPFVVKTKFGDVQLYQTEEGAAVPIVFCQRHKADPAVEYSQPHLINRKAIVQAFVDIKVKAVIGFGSVGTLKLALKPGTLCVSSDFVNFWTTISLSEDASAHIVPGYNEALRKQVIDILTANNLAPKTEAVYVQTIGPRFETAAEIRVLATFGDIVGMTGADEATLCKEGQLPYASVCMIDNYGNGLLDAALSFAAFKDGVHKNQATVELVAQLLVSNLDIHNL